VPPSQPGPLIVLDMEALGTLSGASFYVEPYNLNVGFLFRGPAYPPLKAPQGPLVLSEVSERKKPRHRTPGASLLFTPRVSCFCDSRKGTGVSFGVGRYPGLRIGFGAVALCGSQGEPLA
jgi:hypothetical protein